jgi:VIT1/CCC1 family predicted Fe2+/Mn2+ transporter
MNILLKLLNNGWPKDHAFVLSLIVTGAIFFAIGSAKSRWSTTSWLQSGLVTLFVGAIAAGLAYAAGVILRTFAV